jgi:IS30 family transposase
MVRRRGPRFTPAQKAELWRRWRQGECLNAIGRALGRIPKMVEHVVAGAGGRAPAPRQRSRLALTAAEREEISRGLAHGSSLRAIGRGLGRAPSTVSREVRRHGGRRQYRAADADRRAWQRSRRPKRCRLATHPALRDAVAAKLLLEWSPQQIAGWLRQTYPDDPTMHVSHETIYLSLFVQSRGVLKKTLRAHLRQRHPYRRPKTRVAHPGGYIVDAVSIRERPAAAEDRAVPGHWEGDLLVGTHQSYIATLVERRSRYVCLVRVSGRETQTVVRALTRHVRRLPAGLMTTLTWDRGLELAAHRTFSIATGVQVYFCDPQSPWQRGTNENTNGLLRQYFPKGTDLSGYSQKYLDAIALRLNTRPRKTLGYRTPAVTLADTVASTA